ncbi:MAG: type II toxin-antitoxin system VapC family toxin [Desulfobacteraceae bacterium]|jgi:PIN domain nuclease of toxin-antitoxin system|nr:type II toxin-antitoxin system VapC family toxin [Desulfobacteraceae bacterium]
MIVLDTHAWIWFASKPEALSKRARKAVDAAVKEKNVLVSSISVWEVALLVKNKRLKLSMDVLDWIAKSENLPFIQFIPVSNSIAVKSVNLPQPLHQDPADRIIIATALSTGAPLVTKDKKISDYAHVKTIW